MKKETKDTTQLSFIATSKNTHKKKQSHEINFKNEKKDETNFFANA